MMRRKFPISSFRAGEFFGDVYDDSTCLKIRSFVLYSGVYVCSVNFEKAVKRTFLCVRSDGLLIQQRLLFLVTEKHILNIYLRRVRSNRIKIQFMYTVLMKLNNLLSNID